MKKKIAIAGSTLMLALLPNLAFAQAQTVVNSGDLGAGSNQGITFDSNPDFTGGEFFRVLDQGDVVFNAVGNNITSTENDNNVQINYDADNNGGGSFSIQTGGASVLTADNAGTVTIVNSMTTNGINNGNDGITNAGAISGATTLATSGLATLNSASITNNATVGGTLGVTGGTTLGNTLGVTGATTLSSTLGVTGATTLGNTLGVTGATTLSSTLGVSGATTLNNTLTVDSNGAGAGGTRFVVDGTAATTTSTDGDTVASVSNSGHTLSHVDGADTNSIVVGDTQTGTIGVSSFDYGTTVNGGLFVDGDLGVDGNIYALNPTASSGINVGNNGLDIDGGTNTVGLIADSNSTAGDGRGALRLEEDQASLYVYNQTTGNPHGLLVEQNQTTLSGGTTSTTLTLNDDGATFTNTDTGGPATVTGVADGVNDYDAVNVRQLRTANAGVASVAAMANIPTPQQGKQFSLGLGYGNFQSENAIAFGGGARVNDYVSLKASFGRSNNANTVGAGIGVSW